MELSDLAVIIVAFNSASDIAACLRSVLLRVGALRLDLVVVDVGPCDGTEEIVSGFGGVRYMRCANRGFAHANNHALRGCNARYVLFLNPDTEILQGSLNHLVAAMDERPEVGLAGVRQVDGDGRLAFSIRYFPNALRALGDALSCERLSWRPRWLGERELDPASYDRETDCDWTSGSFMLTRREAIESAGFMDERFFMYCEETDLCRRIKTAGWAVRHLPGMTVRHYGAKGRISPQVESLRAHSRMLYARKHLSRVHRWLYFGTALVQHLLRLICLGRNDLARCRRTANHAALRTLLRLAPPPHAPWSAFSVRPAAKRAVSPSAVRAG